MDFPYYTTIDFWGTVIGLVGKSEPVFSHGFPHEIARGVLQMFIVV